MGGDDFGFCARLERVHAGARRPAPPVSINTGQCFYCWDWAAARYTQAADIFARTPW